MGNRIKDLRVRVNRFDPAEPELGITVYPEKLTSSTQIRGRLMGPRCRYATTVEVAYPLREVTRHHETDGEPWIAHRVTIPEAGFWDPESPFLYEGPVELWQEGHVCDSRQLSVGLRSLTLGRTGLRCNGRAFTLRGALRASIREEEAFQLHRAGCNLLYAPIGAEQAALLTLADRMGFFVLSRISHQEEMAHASALEVHPSFLGWVLNGQLRQDAGICASGITSAPNNHLLGVELEEKPQELLPARVQFIVCTERVLHHLAEIRLPKLVVMARSFQENMGLGEFQATDGTLGCICDSAYA